MSPGAGGHPPPALLFLGRCLPNGERRRLHASVERNHLAQPVHSSEGSIKKRADGAPAVQATHVPVAALAYLPRLARSNRRCHLDPGKAPEVEDRAIPGHWEGDLLSGAKNSYIATLVERHSHFAMLVKVPSKDTAVVVATLSQHVRKLPATLHVDYFRVARDHRYHRLHPLVRFRNAAARCGQQLLTLFQWLPQ